MKGLGEEAKKVFSTLSPEVRGHVSTLAQLLDGSFSLEALQAVVGLDGARVKTVLRRLYDEAPLVIDNDSRRMRIEPLVLHHIRQLGHVTTDDQVINVERFRTTTIPPTPPTPHPAPPSIPSFQVFFFFFRVSWNYHRGFRAVL